MSTSPERALTRLVDSLTTLTPTYHTARWHMGEGRAARRAALVWHAVRLMRHVAALHGEADALALARTLLSTPAVRDAVRWWARRRRAARRPLRHVPVSAHTRAAPEAVWGERTRRAARLRWAAEEAEGVSSRAGTPSEWAYILRGARMAIAQQALGLGAPDYDY